MRKFQSQALKRKVLLVRAAALLLPMVFASALLVQTAFAKTYTITDGSRIVTYTSFATDPAEVLGAAGVRLEENDTYTTEGNASITINRAQNITLMYLGEAAEVSSSGETVGELLARLNLDVTENDILSHNLDSQTFDGMELRIDRVIRQRETYTTTISHETTYCADASIPAGSEEVLTAGVDGEILCTADVTYVNGMETERSVLSESVTLSPVTEVISVGTGAAIEATDPYGTPIIGDGYIILSTGELLTYTKTDTVRATAYTHTDAGCDMITATGTTVRRGTVAVDPRFIPYGTRMFIVSNDGEYVYGLAVAEDCGGAIKRDRMDLYFPTYGECMDFGWRSCTIYFLG